MNKKEYIKPAMRARSRILTLKVICQSETKSLMLRRQSKGSERETPDNDVQETLWNPWNAD